MSREREVEVAVGLEFSWLDDPERERIRRSLVELFGRDLDGEHAPETPIDVPEHFGPMAPAVAAAQDVEAEHRFDVVKAVMETPPVPWPWARHRRSRLQLAR